MAEADSNYNTLILVMLAGGYYYLTTRKKDAEETQTPTKSEDNYHLPIAVAAVIVYSLREEINETITKDRVFLGIAMSLSNYFMEDGGALKASIAALATLILGPAITQEK
tara:strand:- start:137 stop:466 length:330 start_codon:yes stop_codon:yes gene_type:complete